MPRPVFDPASRLTDFLTAIHLWLLDPRSGLGLSEAATRAGMSAAHLHNLLTGRRLLLPRHVAPLVRAFELDSGTAELLGARVQGQAGDGGRVAEAPPEPRLLEAINLGRRRLREAATGSWRARAWIWTLRAPDARAAFAAGAASLHPRTPVQNPRRVDVLLYAFPVAVIAREPELNAPLRQAHALRSDPGGATMTPMKSTEATAGIELDVLDHLDYRDFLRLWYDATLARRPKLSYRWLGQRFGVSGGHIRNVMTRFRRLEPSAASLASPHLGLSGDRALYLPLLVAYNDSRDPLTALRALRELSLIRARNGRPLDHEASSPLLLRWYLPVVLELSTRPEWREDPPWIADTLRPRITPQQAEDALRLLRAGGYLSGGPAGTAPVVQVPDWLADAAVLRFHDECLDVARDVGGLRLEPWEHQAVELGLSADDPAPLESALMRWWEAVRATAEPASATDEAPMAFLFLAHAFGPAPPAPP